MHGTLAPLAALGLASLATAQSVILANPGVLTPTSVGADGVVFDYATDGDVIVSAWRGATDQASSWIVYRVDSGGESASLVCVGKGPAIAANSTKVLTGVAAAQSTAWLTSSTPTTPQSVQVYSGPLTDAGGVASGKFVFSTRNDPNNPGDLMVTDGGPATVLETGVVASREDYLYQPSFFVIPERLFIGRFIFDGTTSLGLHDVEGAFYRYRDTSIYTTEPWFGTPRIARWDTQTLTYQPIIDPSPHLFTARVNPAGDRRRTAFVEGPDPGNSDRLYLFRHAGTNTEMWRISLPPLTLALEATLPGIASRVQLTPNGDYLLAESGFLSSWDLASWTTLHAQTNSPTGRAHLLGNTATHTLFFKRPFVPANSTTQPFELWRTNGTLTGTQFVTTVNARGIAQPPSAVLNDRVLFLADTPNDGHEVWISDGTAAGTQLFFQTYPRQQVDSRARDYHDLDGLALFAAEEPGTGRELYATDGTQAGTLRLADIQPGPGNGINSLDGVAVRGRFYFRASDAPGNEELWVTDGTPAGTQLLKDLHPGSGSAPGSFVAIGNRFYFSADLPTSGGRELWVSDGTHQGTIRAADLQSNYDPFPLGETGRYLLFELRNDLLRFDTVTETVQLSMSLRTGTVGEAGVKESVEIGGDMFFTVTQGAPSTTRRLFRSNGTGPGSGLIDVIQAAVIGGRNYLTEFRGRCYFVAQGGVGGTGLFHTDGTAPTLVPQPTGVTDVRGPLAATEEGLFYSAFDPATGWELYVFDGATTVLVADLTPGTGSTDIVQDMVAMSSDRVAFVTDDATFGREVFASDGTAAGTGVLWDATTGPTGTNPSALARVGTRLHYNGGPGGHPHVVPLSMLDAPLAARAAGTMGCPGSTGVIPEFAFLGAPALGNSQFAVSWTQGLPNAVGLLLLGWTRFPNPLAVGPGCLQYLDYSTQALVTLTDGNGTATVPHAIANTPALLGARYYVRGVTIDPGGTVLGFASATDLGWLLIGN